jgi:hypothetical protein
MPYEGIKATALNHAQLARLWKLVELYVGNVDRGHADVKMIEVLKHLDPPCTWPSTIKDARAAAQPGLVAAGGR